MPNVIQELFYLVTRKIRGGHIDPVFVAGGKVENDDAVQAGFPAGANVEPHGWMEVANGRVDDDPTAFNGTTFSIDQEWAGLWVDIFVDSTGTSTHTVRVLPQFADEDGNWYDFEEGLWASLMWEDVDTASGVYKTFNLPCGGRRLVRFRVIGANTTAVNYFDVIIKVRPYKPAVGIAHA